MENKDSLSGQSHLTPLGKAAKIYRETHSHIFLDNAFVAGSEWQKEQYKPLKEAANMALDYLSVKYPKEASILHELKTAIEKIQD
jgi:hypothetical protein